MNRIAVLAVACALAAGPVAAPAYSSGRPATMAYQLTRAHAAAPPLTVTIAMRVEGDHGAMVVAPAYRGRTAYAADPWMVSYWEIGNALAPWPYVFATGPGGESVRPAECPIAAACGTPAGHDDWYDDQVAVPPRYDAVFVAATGGELRVTASTGWRISRMPASSVRAVLGRDAESVGTGVHVNHLAVEQFHEAAVLGGRHGSVAVATVPCIPLGVMSTCSGTTALLGGAPAGNRSMGDGERTSASASATGATRWRNAGYVMGVGVTLVRLLVLDLPRP